MLQSQFRSLKALPQELIPRGDIFKLNLELSCCFEIDTGSKLDDFEAFQS